jgi:Flp pilus assembly secretin CpaC
MEKLRALAQGRLAPGEASALEEHLQTCASCCHLFEEAPEDSFLGRLRVARELPSADTLCNAGAVTLSGEEPGDLAGHPRYQLVRLLGRGGMGAVYLAHHRHMGRPVALKIINPELLNQRGALPRFQQEVRAAAKLNHPNIVAAHDADQAGSVHFLVMEHVEGQNLADYLKENGTPAVSQACDIIRQAALGLQHAHERGMVHRDIKPHNLMLTPSGQVKVLDFGLARLAAEPASDTNEGNTTAVPHLTGAGAVIGSADYIAPEQARDAHAADCRSDIYSLGCTLYHLLTNRPPFPEGTAPEKLQHHSAVDPCRLTALRPEVANDLAKVVAKMMAKRPEDRYQSAADAASALTRFARPSSRPARRRTRVLALAAVALALVVSAAAAGVVRISAGDREIVIETDDPTIEVVVKGDRIARIVDPKTGKAYQLDRHDLTLSLADDPAGLAVVLDGERPLTLKRQGSRIATVRLATRAVPPVPGATKHLEPAAGPADGGDSRSSAPKEIEPPPAPGNGGDSRTVQLEVIVASVARADARKLAARWTDRLEGKGNGEAASSTRPLSGILKDRQGFLQDLYALQGKGLARVTAEPRVLTQSGRPAWIVSGGEVPIPTTSEKGDSSLSYKMFGTIVSFLPVILHDGKIQLEICPEVSDVDPAMGVNITGPDPVSVPGFRTQKAQALVRMKSAETFVLGGMIDKNAKDGEREFLFIITPHVMDPTPPTHQVAMDVMCAVMNRAEARRLTARLKGKTVPNATVFEDLGSGEEFRRDLLTLRDKGLAKVLTETRVSTLSGRPVWVVSGGETPILTTSKAGAPSVSYKTFGTIISFLPIVMNNGKIHLEVRPEISKVNPAAGITLASGTGITGVVPGFDIRTAQVAAEIEPGQSLGIGGLVQNSLAKQRTSVPVLADIPLLGVLFSSETYTEVEEESIILVTPRLVDPAAAKTGG